MRGGEGVDREMKVVQGVKNEGARNEKAFTLCTKGSAKEKGRSDPSKKSLEIGFETGKSKKRWTSRGKKRARFLEKSPEIGFRMEKSKKNGDFGAKKLGWGRGEKMGFTADFAMLGSGKMGANEIFSHFFSAKSCRECRNALPLHSQSGSNALARESYALKAPRRRKRCCDL